MDEFELRLNEATQKLQECQRVKGFVRIYEDSEYLSCMDCGELIGCAIRREYVEAVYASMNKGSVGGFEF